MGLTQNISSPSWKQKGIRVCLRREDLLHPGISGNKFRKLKYNLEAAKNNGSKTLLTFGGAYSNHIAAVAYAGAHYGFNTVGVIRGEELRTRWQANPTLALAHQYGMQFKFVSRSVYRQKNDPAVRAQLNNEFDSCYILPEGGTNELGVQGCAEILSPGDEQFDLVCCAVGTGGTISGLSLGAFQNQRVLGFSVVRDPSLKDQIRKFTAVNNWDLNYSYHMGGYAKVNFELIQFMNQFKLDNRIQLDPVYTGKMIYGLFDMIENNNLGPYQNILAVHSGGLQGIEGMNTKLKDKKLPAIKL